MEDYKDEDCEHTDGSYFCFESGYDRCKCCGIVLNATKEEFYKDL